MTAGTAVAGLALLAALAVAGGLFARRMAYLVALVRHGREVARSDEVPVRVRREVTGVLGQSKLWLRPVPGLMHLLLFWGFLVLIPTVVMSMLGAVHPTWTLPWLAEQGWFALLVDLFALGVLTGVAIAFAIRLGQRPVRFVGSRLRQAHNILLFEAAIAGTLFLWHGARIALGINEAPAGWTPVSAAVAGLLPGGTAGELLERTSVWLHVLLILAFLVYIPYTKHLHILVAPFNVWFGRTRSPGRLEPLRLDDPDLPEDQIRFGAGTAGDLTWKQMVDAMSCTECGRCQDACPAFATGKDLSPKLVVMGIRDQLYREGRGILAGTAGGDGTARGDGTAGGDRAAAPPAALTPLVPGAVRDETVWDCVTCGACVRECPVGIEHIDHLVDLRRNLVMVDARFPAPAMGMLRDLERTSDPWGRGAAARTEWTEGLGVRVLRPGDPPPELLFWVGCAPAFDERARTAAVSTVRLLQRARVDFAILGPRERCTGDPARRIGDEYTFQGLATGNVETLTGAGIRRIVTTCPHCFNALGREYPDFGGDYEVIHHTQLLAELVREGRLAPVAGSDTITYHDSCYLARHNDVRADPRQLVAAVGRPLEMARREERTFCCGAGGGHMWLEERGDQINAERAREAAATGAGTLAVACPFCVVMLDDGVRANGSAMVVKDVATLLAEAVERGVTQGAGARAPDELDAPATEMARQDAP